MSLLCHDYTYYLSYYFSYYVIIHCIMSLLCHYYCYYLYYYFILFQSFASLFSGLVDAYYRLMHRAMTDKCPGAPAKLWGEQASSHYEAKPTYSAEKRLLYALFLVLFLLFWLSVQDLAAWNIDLRTVGQHAMILWDVSQHCIKNKAPLHVT